MAAKKSKTDKRLMGTWQSDRARTLKELRYRPGMTAKQRKMFRGLFGHLRLSYGRKYVHGVLRDYHFTDPYQVIASDQHSVVIRMYSKVLEQWTLYHVHFADEDHYWVAIGFNREWFKRLK